jgi:hypothetical protein
MEVTYYLKESEFDLSIFESIKTAFKNRLMKISIETEDSTIVTQEKNMTILFQCLMMHSQK